jgi:predicted transcriptional regulator of viral defense system
MPIIDELLGVAGHQRGYVTVDDARDLNVAPVELRKMAARGRLEHRGHGLYRIAAFPYSTHDDLMEAALWADGVGTISHESALILWDVCDANPRHIHVTIPRRMRRHNPDEYHLHQADVPMPDRDWIAGIPVTSIRRTISDSATTGTDPHLINQAIESAVRKQLIGKTDAEGLQCDIELMSARTSAAWPATSVTS